MSGRLDIAFALKTGILRDYRIITIRNIGYILISRFWNQVDRFWAKLAIEFIESLPQFTPFFEGMISSPGSEMQLVHMAKHDTRHPNVVIYVNLFVYV